MTQFVSSARNSGPFFDLLPYDLVCAVFKHINLQASINPLTLSPEQSGAFLQTCKRFHLIGREGLDPGCKQSALLVRACRAGRAQLVKKLVQDPRVDPFARTCSALHAAAALGDGRTYRIIEDLLASMAKKLEDMIETAAKQHVSEREDPFSPHMGAFCEVFIRTCQMGLADSTKSMLDFLKIYLRCWYKYLPGEKFYMQNGWCEAIAVGLGNAIRFGHGEVVHNILRFEMEELEKHFMGSEGSRTYPWLYRIEGLSPDEGELGLVEYAELFGHLELAAALRRYLSQFVDYREGTSHVQPLSHETIQFLHACLQNEKEVIEEPGRLNFLQLVDLRYQFLGLSLACSCSYADSVKALLNLGHFPPTNGWFQVLVDTVRWGSLETVRLILNNPCFQLSLISGKALQLACRFGRPEVVQLLLQDLGIDPSNEALNLACQFGHPEIAQQLLRDPRVDPSKEDNKALNLACRYGHPEVVQLLLRDPRVDPSKEDNKALNLACRYGHVKVVQLLLQELRVDPSKGGYEQPLNIGSRCGHPEVVQALLQDPRVDPKTSNAILTACEYGFWRVVQVFLQDKRIDPAADFYRILWIAAEYGHGDVIKVVLEDPRVDPNAAGLIAMLVAAKNGRLDVVEFLLRDRRIDPSFKKGEAIWTACSSPRIVPYRGAVEQTIQKVLKDGRIQADVLHRLFFRAIDEWNPGWVKILLLDGRVDPSSGNNKCLNRAAMEGNVELVKMLLSDPRIKISSGEIHDLRHELLCALKTEKIDRDKAPFDEVIKMLDDDPEGRASKHMKLSTEAGLSSK